MMLAGLQSNSATSQKSSIWAMSSCMRQLLQPQLEGPRDSGWHMPDNRPIDLPPPSGEPDAHGQAALILAESILHALVETKILTTQQALDVVHSAEEIKAEVAALSSESNTRMHESLELLKRIGYSIEKDIDGL